MRRFSVSLSCISLLFFSFSQTRADTFGTGANSFEIEFVPIGNPGNASDFPFIWGDVPYRYRIAKYEISEQMIDRANALSVLEITKDTRGPDMPATSITWFEAARLVNWLNADAGFHAAYKFDALGNFQLWQPTDPGYSAHNLFRNKLARYVLPSTDEWYKAAYYDPANGVYYDYPTGSDIVPDGIDFVGDTVFDSVFHDGAANPAPNDITDVGLLSPHGTAGQGGNVDEWEETGFFGENVSATQQRGSRGGSWDSPSSGLVATNHGIGIPPSFQGSRLGFRVACIPEPNNFVLSTIGFLGIIGCCQTMMRQRSN